MPLRSWTVACSCRYLTQFTVGRLGTRGLEPDEEAIDDKPAVDGEQNGCRVEVRVDQQRDADHVDGDPRRPEVGPASRHRVGRNHGADEDPGIAPVVPTGGGPAGADLREDPLRDDHATDPYHDVLQSFCCSRPARGDRGGAGGALLADLAPTPVAINAGDDEEDLPTGLSVERLVLGSDECHSEEDREQQHVADDPDRPCPDPTPEPADGRCEPEGVTDDLTPEDLLAEDAQLRVEPLLKDAHVLGPAPVVVCASGWLAAWVSSRA